ncbi:ribulose-1,5 bisphosphate carboxylase/oxygenase [Cryptosporidium felis]|nr:ribulose-1,5 bisphosphate carboxylase/oxygenase [Cryptosporidium felis]
MDFIIKLPVELEADETLLRSRKRLLEQWGLPDSQVTLWLKEDLNDTDRVHSNLEHTLNALVTLVHSFYVSSMTDKDAYLALAYNREEYTSKATLGKVQVDSKVAASELLREHSARILAVPYYNPMVMIKALLLLKSILRDEISSLGEVHASQIPESNYLFLLGQCAEAVSVSLASICRPSEVETEFSSDFQLIPSYFDEIIESLSDGERDKHSVLLRKVTLGIHPVHGRGLFSTERIPADTNVVEISLNHSLSFYTAIYSPEFGFFARFLTNPTQYLAEMETIAKSSPEKTNPKQNFMYQPVDHDSVLLLFVVYLVYLGDKSKWSKVISTWQSPLDACNQNMYMAPKEVVDFLSHGGTDFSSRVSASIDELYDMILHVHYLLGEVRKMANRISDKLELEGQEPFGAVKFFRNLDFETIFTWKRFNQVKYVLDTRSFSIKWWPLNPEFYQHQLLQEAEKKLITQSADTSTNLELVSIPVSDFSANGTASTDLLLPVPTDGIRTILPIADMFNHSHLAPCSSPTLDHEANRVCIKTEVEVPPNSEVFIRYGILTTGESLYGYGFIPETKPVAGMFDTITLNLEPEEDDPLYKMKMLVLKHSNIPTDHIFSRLSFEKLTNEELLFKCIDVVTSNDPISSLQNWEKKGWKFNKRTGTNFPQIVSEILESLLKPSLERYDMLTNFKSSSPDSVPFWYQDWGERALQYYSNQINLIKLSMEKFSKKGRR